MKVAIALGLILGVLILNARQVDSSYGYVCGTFGPLHWFNLGPTLVTTASYGSPLGIILGAPYLFGCYPSGVSVYRNGQSNYLQFNYSSVDPNLHLVTGTNGTGFAYSATFQAQTTGKTVLTDFQLDLPSGTTIKSELTYNGKSPHLLLNFSTVSTSSRRSLPQGSFKPLQRFLRRNFDERVTRNKGFHDIWDLFSYSKESYPGMPSEILIYYDGVINSEIQYNYSSVNKGHLLGSETAHLTGGGANQTVSYAFSYSKEFNLLLNFRMTSTNNQTGNPETTTLYDFTYDSYNRLTQVSGTDNHNLYISYDNLGHVSTLNDTRLGYNFTFIH